jgi:CelD/BcsL family acetyltransferase involved in cellulose biosynthesis
MGAFLDTYGKWLVERHGQSSLFDIPLRDVGEFLTDFTRRSAEKGWISLSFLMLDQKPASSYYGFTYDNCFYLYMTGWDPKYSHYGVGNIHTMSLIKRSIELGLERFDLLRGDERYKERWNPIRKSNVRVILLKKTLKGRLCYRLLKAMEHRRTKSFLERFGIGEN